MKSSNDAGSASRARRKPRLVTAGRDTKAQKGFVNPPVVHGSTVLYPTADGPARPSRRVPVRPPRHPDHQGVAGDADGAGGPAMRRRRHRALGPGCDLDHPALGAEGRRPLLVCDNVYRPTRNFCNGLLARYGVETSYFDPLIGAGIDETVQAEHPGRAGRGAGLAILRNARHPRHRRGRACARRARHRRQHLGDAAAITARWSKASTSACRPPPNISAAIPTSCSARSRPMPRPGR